jgi:hypothetical protein
MLDRIERGRSRSSMAASLLRPVELRRPAGFLRPLAGAAAVAAVVVAAFTGISMADRPDQPGRATAPVAAGSPAVSASPTPSAPSPSGSATTSRPAIHHSLTGTAPAEATSRATTAPSASATAPVVRDGYLSATATVDAGSTNTWSQTDVTLTTTRTTGALVVEITVARTAGVAKTGHWSSVPESMTTTEVDTSAGSLLYRFTLKPGSTLAPGTYTFAAQFGHAAGPRSLAGDSYRATSDGAQVTGAFTG